MNYILQGHEHMFGVKYINTREQRLMVMYLQPGSISGMISYYILQLLLLLLLLLMLSCCATQTLFSYLLITWMLKLDVCTNFPLFYPARKCFRCLQNYLQSSKTLLNDEYVIYDTLWNGKRHN